MDLSASTIFAGFVFSTIGGSVWMYGKKRTEMRSMLLGGALFGLPFLLDGIPLWCAGVALTGLVFWPR